MKKCMLFLAAAVLLSGCSGEKTPVETPLEETAAGPKQILAWGEVKYEDSYELSLSFPTTVTDVHVQAGDAVGFQTPLLTLDMVDYESNLTALEGQNTALQKDIAQLRDDISTKTRELNEGTKVELKLLQDTVTRMEKEVADARKDLEDRQELFAQGHVSQAEVDTYADILEQKEKGKTDAENNLAKTRRSLQEEIDGLKVSLAYKEAQLGDGTTSELEILRNQTAKDYILENQVVCPLEHGIVKAVYVVNGSAVATQGVAQKVVELIDADSLMVYAEVPEEFVGQVTMDSGVEILPAAGGTLNGHVAQIAQLAEEKDGERIVIVKVKAEDPEGRLKPGYTADVYFTVD